MIPSSAVGPPVSAVTSQKSSAVSAPTTTPPYNSGSVSIPSSTLGSTAMTTSSQYTAGAAVRRPAAALGVFGIIALVA